MSITLKRLIKNISEVKLPEVQNRIKSKFDLNLSIEIDWSTFPDENSCAEMIDKVENSLTLAFEVFLIDEMAKSAVEKGLKNVFVFHDGNVETFCELKERKLTLRANWAHFTVSEQSIVYVLNQVLE